MANKKGESKKLTIIRTTLTTEQFDELRLVRVNPFEFAKHIKVIHPTKGKIFFRLFPYQKAVLKSFIDNRFNIILKFRQAGLTELIAMFCLWFAMYHDAKNIQIISIKERTAKRVLKRIKFMYENLPDHLKVPVVNGRGDELGTSTELEFSNRSIITSIPTTEEAGRSEAASLLVIDEAAAVRWASVIWAAAFPTLSTGGRAIINSTPIGVGNFFHKMWVGAMTGDNPFVPIRLRWQMHPWYDQAWYETMSQSLGPRRTAQEIDGDFLTSGHTVFDLADIRDIEEEIRNLEYKEVLMNGQLLVLEDPRPGDFYTIGGDVSTGRSRDYSSLSIMNQDGDEFVCFRGKVSPTKLAKMFAEWGYRYNRAVVAPEANDIGLATAENLQDNGYPNLYYSRKVLRKKGQKRKEIEQIPGWYTNTKTRPLMISGLEEDLRLKNLRIIDPFFVQESYTFIYDGANRPVALGKDKKSSGDDLIENEEYTDDAIMGKSIVNYVRKIPRKGPIVLAR